MSNTTRNNSIDAIRGVACILVVFVHCVLPGQLGQYIIAYARFAVPFFILVSGWFSFSENNQLMLARFSKKLKDMASLAFSAVILYLIWNSINNFVSTGDPIGWLVSYFSNSEAWFNLLVYNRAVFLNSVTYYLLMMLYVYPIVGILVKKNMLHKIMWFVPVGLVFNYVLGAVFRAPWYHSGNFLLTALPFFLLGMKLHSWAKTHSVKRFHLCVALGTGVVLTFIESSFLGDVYCYIGTIITSVSILLLCVSDKTLVLPEWLAKFGRNYSTYIFILHCGVRDSLKLVINGTHSDYFQWIMPWAAIAISVLIARICMAIRQNSREQKKL